MNDDRIAKLVTELVTEIIKKADHDGDGDVCPSCASSFTAIVCQGLIEGVPTVCRRSEDERAAFRTSTILKLGVGIIQIGDTPSVDPNKLN